MIDSGETESGASFAKMKQYTHVGAGAGANPDQSMSESFL